MKYNLAFKYRIYPNKDQELLINKTFGCVRFVYNTILYTANKIYEETGKNKIITPARLKKLQKSLSRKVRFSKNWYKQKMKISKLHEYIKNCRRDFLHKLSKKLSEEYNAVVVEDLNMKGMSQALNFGKSVGDNGWGMFLRMLEYKLMFLGKQFLKIDKWFPSSKTCSKCGNVKEELKLSERSYKCECCGIEIDRDYNAALNIRDVGKEMLKY